MNPFDGVSLDEPPMAHTAEDTLALARATRRRRSCARGAAATGLAAGIVLGLVAVTSAQGDDGQSLQIASAPPVVPTAPTPDASPASPLPTQGTTARPSTHLAPTSPQAPSGEPTTPERSPSQPAAVPTMSPPAPTPTSMPTPDRTPPPWVAVPPVGTQTPLTRDNVVQAMQEALDITLEHPAVYPAEAQVPISMKAQYYDKDVTFRMQADTNPITCADFTQPEMCTQEQLPDGSTLVVASGYNSNGDVRARYAHLVRPDRVWLALSSYNYSSDRDAPRSPSKDSYPTLTLPQMRAAVVELSARFRPSTSAAPTPTASTAPASPST